MIIVLTVIQILIAVALIAVVLLQRSEGGGLGIGGSGGMGNFMTARGTANLLTRTTAVLAALFMAMSLALAILAGGPRERASVIDNLTPVAPSPGAPSAPTGAPAPPAAPGGPAVPTTR